MTVKSQDTIIMCYFIGKSTLISIIIIINSFYDKIFKFICKNIIEYFSYFFTIKTSK